MNFLRKYVRIVVRFITSFSLLLSTALPAAAEVQYPAGTAADNPYDYVSSGTINNPSGSVTTILSASLKENTYTTDTGRCGTDVNNGTFSLSYIPSANDDLYVYELTAKTTNLATNETSQQKYEYGARVGDPMYKLLNIYPAENGRIGHRLMTEIRPEGGHYYEDPVTGEQIFSFDEVYWQTFMQNPSAYLYKDASGNWNYDGIYMGAADSNGGVNDGGLNQSGVDLLRAFVNDGGALVQGHDIPHPFDSGNDYLKALFFPYFGYEQGMSSGVQGFSELNTITITLDGDPTHVTPQCPNQTNKLTTYPYKFYVGQTYSVATTHPQWWIKTSRADTWATIAGGDNTLLHGEWSSAAYLYTSKQYPNVAHSTTGHTTPNSNDLKLVVNMLLYILPRRNKQNSQSITVKDIAAPARPNISQVKRTGNSNLMFQVNADDFATKFDFTLQASGAYSSDVCNSDSKRSPITLNNAAIKSGTTWYLYSADTDENGTISYTTNCLGLPVASGETTMVSGGVSASLSVTIPATATYLHIAAVDKAGNVGEVTTVEIPRTEDLTIQKVFEDFENRYNLRPAEIIFDAFSGSDTTSSGNCTASDDNGYSCTISDLLAYDTNGDEISYTVKERNTPNAYTASEPTIVIAQNKSITVINTLVTESIPIRKVWLDDDNRDSFRPDRIQFTLFCGEVECGDNPYTITGDDNWGIIVPDIPVYDENGQEYSYSVVELGGQ